MNKKVVSSNFARLVRETPLIQRPFLAKSINHDSIQHKKMPNVFYKLENLQFSGSFKDRGLGFMIDTLHQQKPITKLIW
jgi:threonine dehydratase